MLLQKIKDLLKAFDAELRLLRHEKIHLDVDLKNADLRFAAIFVLISLSFLFYSIRFNGCEFVS